MTDDQRSETLDLIARQLATAAQIVIDSRRDRAPQPALGTAHKVASSALEKLDKLVIKDSLATPMFGGG